MHYRMHVLPPECMHARTHAPVPQNAHLLAQVHLQVAAPGLGPRGASVTAAARQPVRELHGGAAWLWEAVATWASHDAAWHEAADTGEL